MGVTAVLTTQARPGKYARVRDGIGELKTILEKEGVTARLIRPVTGGQQGHLSLVSEYDSWAAFGAAADKLQASSAYRELMARGSGVDEPAIDSMTTNFYTDVD